LADEASGILLVDTGLLKSFVTAAILYATTEMDTLLGGRFLTRANLDHKRRRIENLILADAHAALCSAPAAAASVESIRRACTAAILKGLDEAEVTAEPHQVGMIAAVCARLVATPSVAQWCATSP
jgi:hypothetical protein